MKTPRRGAKPLSPAEPVGPVLDADKLAERNQPIAVMNSVQANYSDERDLVNQLLGQAQMAEAFSKFSKTVFTSKIAHVKETKTYRALAGKQTEDGLHFSGTWEEFCNLLGMTPQHANESIEQLRAFGEEALESMSRMGIGYRELRQYRRLPEDSKEALIEAAKTGDKEGLLELAEELISRQTREKAELARQVEDARADIEAKDERAAARERTIENLQKQVRKERGQRERATPDETAKQLQQAATSAVMQVRVDLLARGDEVDSVAERFRALREHALAIGDPDTGVGNQFDAFMAGLLGDLFTELRLIRNEFNLPDVNDAPPAWMQER